ncbi:hypothetical protein ACKUFS_13840 [Pseudomonas cannabina]|uniref:Uncharacterized protein n=2 Tax=Pseudomonas syringae group TaxID=136849 RepID=A0A8T8BYQ1_PSEYM|nr:MULTISPECIES: hypothetical protein [Pseudomonas syringae group]MBM0142135.1 hypothetical protein [Pseudomonas cannabina pv. alisalensis]QHE96401.1 hypothetical protein PMA4326_007100 [Pseudomonas syringae pv. maculicola str. ES4326]QQN20540.1 hypothetical protein JGS08_18200 [Pseudomonas cannabina pv. alisalensis]UBY97059.1 hypothetical protein LCG56_24450 [Pseudomonas cannabina pv. alisalensis]
MTRNESASVPFLQAVQKKPSANRLLEMGQVHCRPVRASKFSRTVAVSKSLLSNEFAAGTAFNLPNQGPALRNICFPVQVL